MNGAREDSNTSCWMVSTISTQNYTFFVVPVDAIREFEMVPSYDASFVVTPASGKRGAEVVHEFPHGSLSISSQRRRSTRAIFLRPPTSQTQNISASVWRLIGGPAQTRSTLSLAITRDSFREGIPVLQCADGSGRSGDFRKVLGPIAPLP